MATALKSLNQKSIRDRRAAARRSAHLRPVPGPARSAAISPTVPPLRSTAMSRRPGEPAAPSRSPATVRQLPTQRPFPLWLRLLIQAQRGSAIVALILGGATLIVYSSAIFVQQQWSKDYQKLKTMQRSERQMIAAGEFLKNQIIQQAEQPGSGLVPKSSANMIYLEPSADRPPVTLPANPIVQSEPDSEEDPTAY